LDNIINQGVRPPFASRRTFGPAFHAVLSAGVLAYGILTNVSGARYAGILTYKTTEYGHPRDSGRQVSACPSPEGEG